MPNGTTIAVNADDDWVFPPGAVLVKNFRLNGRLIETRHLMCHPDGVWAGYTYEWNVAQTEATRVRGGKTVTVEGQEWVFPDEAEWLRCHTAVTGVALGPETAQMNRDFSYPSTGRTHNQLETLDSVAMFDTPIGDAAALPNMPAPVNLDLRYTTSLADTNACDVILDAGDLGLTMARIIAPGDSSRSVLVARMSRRDANGMPPLASATVDAVGVSLVSDWIDGLVNCN